MSRQLLIEIYDRLFERYGEQHWWPGQSQFEIVVGAILTQNTSWTNVEKAIANLRDANALTPQALRRLSHDALAALIRPAGYFNIKAQRLIHFLNWLFDEHEGNLENLQNLPLSVLREQLVAVKGIGPETADSICLYAFERPIFVVDAYTARVFGRHGLIEPGSGYEQIQDLSHSSLPKETQLFNEYHALLVRVGKEYCRPKPRCEDCPLEPLPHQSEPDGY